MKRRLPRKKDQVQSAYETYALSASAQADPQTGATVPTDTAVEEAKSWVDENEK